jgi:hypothetical protein
MSTNCLDAKFTKLPSCWQTSDIWIGPSQGEPRQVLHLYTCFPLISNVPEPDDHAESKSRSELENTSTVRIQIRGTENESNDWKMV